MFARCKLLDKWDRVLPESELGMSKVLCHGYMPRLALSVTEPWKSREKFLYHTSLFPAALQGCQVCGPVAGTHSCPGRCTAEPLEALGSRSGVSPAWWCWALVAHLLPAKRDSRDPICIITAALFWCPMPSQQSCSRAVLGAAKMVTP